MGTRSLKSLAFAALLLGFPAVANAAEFMETQVQTVDGQDFNFIFSPAPAPTGDGLLELLIRGDFSGDFPGIESYDLDLEGVFGRTNLGLTLGRWFRVSFLMITCFLNHSFCR